VLESDPPANQFVWNDINWTIELHHNDAIAILFGQLINENLKSFPVELGVVFR
jgi:hypothetical protein